MSYFPDIILPSILILFSLCRAKAIAAVKNLIKLILGASCGDITSLEALVRSLFIFELWFFYFLLTKEESSY